MSHEQPADEVVALLSRTWFTAFLRGAESWARLDVTMPQLKVLMLLGLHGSATVSSLAGRLNTSPPNITGILDRLEQHRLTRRTNDPADRRVVRAVLTDEGHNFLTAIQQASDEPLRSRLTELAPADQRALRQGLSALLSVTIDDQRDYLDSRSVAATA